ncbi:hypothetical protein B1A_04061, partial [mine drainage metagenome]
SMRSSGRETLPREPDMCRFLRPASGVFPAGNRVTRFRAESASHQVSVIHACQERGIRFCIGADLDSVVRHA